MNNEDREWQHFELMQRQSKERTIRDAHAARKAQKVLDDKLHKERKQEQLWRRIYWSCMILLGLIIIYSLWKAL